MEVDEDLKYEHQYAQTYGLPIDYDKDESLLVLGYEGGKVNFTDAKNNSATYRSEFIAFKLPAEHVLDNM